MFGIPKAIKDKCVVTRTAEDNDTVVTRYVLYTKDGEEVELSRTVAKVSVVDAKIAELQGEKVILEAITKGEIDEESIVKQ